MTNYLAISKLIRMLIFLFFKIFKRYQQHSETFAMFFIEMFVVHFVCSSDGSQVPVVAVSEYFETLMDKNIVNQKVAKTINRNSNPHK